MHISSWATQMDFHLQLWLLSNKIHKSHDATLLHNIIKLCLFFIVLIERHQVAGLTFCAYKTSKQALNTNTTLCKAIDSLNKHQHQSLLMLVLTILTKLVKAKLQRLPLLLFCFILVSFAGTKYLIVSFFSFWS